MNMNPMRTVPATPDAAGPARRIVHRTRGHGGLPITRLMSPSDLGQLLKPFVFLDRFVFEDPAEVDALPPMHPHSGIATLTHMFEGELTYQDTTGRNGVLRSGGVEWMMAGGGVWHTGAAAAHRRTSGFQLWVALPPALENAPALSMYLDPEDVPGAGPAKVLLGAYGGLESRVPAPSPMTYLAVRLRAGEDWTYQPPPGHVVAWVALGSGNLSGPSTLVAGDLVVFEEAGKAIDFHAENDTAFVLGSAAKHPHALVMGAYSVHTSEQALRLGLAGIRKASLLRPR